MIRERQLKFTGHCIRMPVRLVFNLYKKLCFATKTQLPAESLLINKLKGNLKFYFI